MLLTTKEKLEQKRIEALLIAEKNKEKELNNKYCNSGKNVDTFYSKKRIQDRIKYGHPEDYDMSFKKKSNDTSYVHVKKQGQVTIYVNEYLIKRD